MNTHISKKDEMFDILNGLHPYNIEINSIELISVDPVDYPDFCDAYYAYAEFKDGISLTEEQLIYLQDNYPDFFYERLMDCVW